MPVSLSLNCEVSQSDIDDFVKALSRYQSETQRDLRSALRSATIDLLRSLRARTHKAKKFIERLEIAKSQLPPKWIKRGNSGKPIRRMQLLRWSSGKSWFDHRYVYGGDYFQGPKGGLRVRPFSVAQMRKAAQANYGSIRNWSLAKKSWGWFMKSLFRQTMQDENPQARITSNMVSSEMVERHETLPNGTVDVNAPVRCDINIINKLSYIRDAMPPGVLEVALRKATNLINKKVESGLRSRKFSA